MKRHISQHICLLLLLSATTFFTAQAQEANASEAVAELTAALDLSDQQSQQFGSAMGKYTASLQTLFEEQEAEDADPANLIAGARSAQSSFDKEIKSFLSKEQYQQFNAMREQAIKGMLTDMSAIQLMEVQAQTTITDAQIDELAPIMGNARFGIMQIAWENAGKTLRPAQKVSLSRKIKSMQRETEKALEKVLSPEQMEAWEAYKAEKTE